MSTPHLKFGFPGGNFTGGGWSTFSYRTWCLQPYCKWYWFGVDRGGIETKMQKLVELGRFYIWIDGYRCKIWYSVKWVSFLNSADRTLKLRTFVEEFRMLLTIGVFHRGLFKKLKKLWQVVSSLTSRDSSSGGRHCGTSPKRHCWRKEPLRRLIQNCCLLPFVRGHYITHFVGNQAIQIYGNVQGFPLLIMHCLGWKKQWPLLIDVYCLSKHRPVRERERERERERNCKNRRDAAHIRSVWILWYMIKMQKHLLFVHTYLYLAYIYNIHIQYTYFRDLCKYT